MFVADRRWCVNSEFAVVSGRKAPCYWFTDKLVLNPLDHLLIVFEAVYRLCSDLQSGFIFWPEYSVFLRFWHGAHNRKNVNLLLVAKVC